MQDLLVLTLFQCFMRNMKIKSMTSSTTFLDYYRANIASWTRACWAKYQKEISSRRRMSRDLASYSPCLLWWLFLCDQMLLFLCLNKIEPYFLRYDCCRYFLCILLWQLKLFILLHLLFILFFIFLLLRNGSLNMGAQFWPCLCFILPHLLWSRSVASRKMSSKCFQKCCSN